MQVIDTDTILERMWRDAPTIWTPLTILPSGYYYPMHQPATFLNEDDDNNALRPPTGPSGRWPATCLNPSSNEQLYPPASSETTRCRRSSVTEGGVAPGTAGTTTTIDSNREAYLAELKAQLTPPPALQRQYAMDLEAFRPHPS